jgi:hypothetical protein
VAYRFESRESSESNHSRPCVLQIEDGLFNRLSAICHDGGLDSQPKPTTQPCSLKQQLIVRLEAAHTMIADLHNREMQGLIRGDFADDSDLMAELKSERAARDEIVYQLRQHIAEHGC